MAIVLITGTPAELQSLLDLEWFILDHHDSRRADGGRVTISSHMPESEIPVVEALGLTVDVEVTDAEFEAHMASFDDDGPPIA